MIKSILFLDSTHIMVCYDKQLDDLVVLGKGDDFNMGWEVLFTSDANDGNDIRYLVRKLEEIEGNDCITGAEWNYSYNDLVEDLYHRKPVKWCKHYRNGGNSINEVCGFRVSKSIKQYWDCELEYPE